MNATNRITLGDDKTPSQPSLFFHESFKAWRNAFLDAQREGVLDEMKYYAFSVDGDSLQVTLSRNQFKDDGKISFTGALNQDLPLGENVCFMVYVTQVVLEESLKEKRN